MTVAINKTYGSFSLSDKAMAEFLALKDTEYTTKDGVYGVEFYYTDGNQIHLCNMFDTDLALRTDPDLIKVIETLGDEASGNCSKVALIAVPNGIEIEINEYDGYEWVAEKHRRWY